MKILKIIGIALLFAAYIACVILTWHQIPANKEPISGIIVSKKMIPSHVENRLVSVDVVIAEAAWTETKHQDVEVPDTYMISIEIPTENGKIERSVCLSKERYDSLKVGDLFEVKNGDTLQIQR